MADQDTGTGNNGDQGTGGTPPAATPIDQKPVDGKPAATDTGGQNGDDTVVLSKKDHAALVAQRDRANEAGRTDAEAFAQLQYDFYKNQAVDNAVKTYPDVPREVLETADSPEAMETLAKLFQKHAQETKQKALKDLEVVDTGTLTPEQKAERYNKLKGTGDLAGAIALKLAP